MLSLEAVLEVRAHPEKVTWGGEDTGFFAGRTRSVFDGVSGAAKERGKKLYSRCLADTMKKSVTGAGKAAWGGGRAESVRQITDYLLEAKKLAYREATAASTAAVASIGEDNVVRALNLRDSVCLVTYTTSRLQSLSGCMTKYILLGPRIQKNSSAWIELCNPLE